MKIVYVVNGLPRAGKDTLIGMLCEYLDTIDVPYGSFSSIAPVKAMLAHAGFYLDGKSEADRKLLATVGDAVEEHSNRRTNDCCANVREFFDDLDDGVFFLHIREPANIERVKWLLAAESIRVLTVLVESNRSENVTSNPADAGVRNGRYDRTVQNNGSLKDLVATAGRFLKTEGFCLP